MTLFPQRTVAFQIATQLRNDIHRGLWRKWLPSERTLSKMLQASRNSVRAALIQLKAEGIIIPVRGFGNKVCSKVLNAPPRTMSKMIGLIVPESMVSLRPAIALWIDELKDLLADSGQRLRIHQGQQYYTNTPHCSLERLLEQNPSDAWVLVLSSHAMQKWFKERSVPCVIAGSPFSELDLPSFDLDHRVCCRHAAGVLLRLGHRRVGLLNHKSDHAGDIESHLGFLDGVQSFVERGAAATISCHSNDVESVGRALRRLIDRREPITGILVCGSYAYLATSTLLTQRGLRIPHDISLISRDDDPFLQFISPLPTRYLAKPHIFAKNIHGIIQRLALGLSVKRLQNYMLPRLLTCDTTGAPPKL